MAQISVRSLEKSFKVGARSQLVFSGLNLEIEKGEYLAITGRSGSGKSTLLHILAGLEKADRGEVFIEQKNICLLDIEELADFRLRQIGVVFQFFHLLPNLSLLENMLVPGYLLGRDRAGIAKRATELADWVGISHVIKKLPSQVSGGELQRAAVARSLVNAPAILLADEPTGSLDAESGEQVMKLFSKAQKEYGTTVILVTHDRQIAGQADRVWAIDGVSA